MRAIIVSTLLFSAILQLILIVYAWKRRDVPAAKPFIYAAFISFVWIFTYAIDLASDDLLVKRIWMQIRFTFTSYLSLAILLMVLEHLDLIHRLTRARMAALQIVPLLTVLLIWTSPYHHLFRYDFVVTQVNELQILMWKSGPLLTIILLYNYLLHLTSSYFLFRSVMTGELPIKRRRSGLMLLGLVVPFTVDALYSMNITPIPGFNFTPHTLAYSVGVLAYCFFRYGLLDLVPLARNMLVELIPSGVLVLDIHSRIIDINASAQRILRVSTNVVGQNIRLALSHLDSSMLAKVDVNELHTEIQAEDEFGESHYFDVNVVPLKDNFDRVSGRLIIFHNITDYKFDERESIARDLHDAVSQTIFSARLTSEMLLLQTDRQSESFTRSLMNINRLMRSAFGELRLMLYELRTNAISEADLASMLGNLVDSGFARTHANIALEVHAEEISLPAAVKVVMYRITQESLSNAIKHAEPQNIYITLNDREDGFEISIRDDGKGFATNATTGGQFGLSIMHERAKAARLELEVVSAPGLGTTVTTRWKKEQA